MLAGLTTQRLFKKVLEVGAPHLFMASFNEHIGGRQTSEFPNANTAINMGLPYDPQNGSVWADTYASEFSRDLEPNKVGICIQTDEYCIQIDEFCSKNDDFNANEQGGWQSAMAGDEFLRFDVQR